MEKKRRLQDVPVKWYIFLPLLGIIHRSLSLFGWLEQEGWLNYLLLLGIIFLWLFVVLKETDEPFSPLVWMGSIYGILTAIMEFIFWYIYRDPLGLEETVWSFNDLMYAISYYLRPGFLFFGRIVVSVLLGVLLGFTANLILKFQQKRR